MKNQQHQSQTPANLPLTADEIAKEIKPAEDSLQTPDNPFLDDQTASGNIIYLTTQCP